MKKLLLATVAILALGAFAIPPAALAQAADGKAVGEGIGNPGQGQGNDNRDANPNKGSGNNSGDGTAEAPGQNK